MPNPIAHFDIAVDDLARAKRFYERVFGWTFESWGPPDFFLIWTRHPHEPGTVHGSLSKRREPRAGSETHGWECTISVDDLAAIRAAILANGGKILREDEEIVGVGTLFQFADPDGNVACAMKYVRQPQP
jgi:predicted enzyme related to lactoylglutathione lyase